MKSYQIVVNGKTYDVDVIPKKNGGVQIARVEQQMAKPAVPAKPAAPAATPAPAPAPKAAPAPAAAGQTIVSAPLPGVVNAVNVKVGDHVEPNTILFVLEAMKMENEIFAGVAGTVREICVAKGAAVDTDGKLAVIG